MRLRALQPGFYALTALGGPEGDVTAEIAVNQAAVSASDLHDRVGDQLGDEIRVDRHRVGTYHRRVTV